MYLETERLIIRSIKPEDEKEYIEIASDGSLDEDIFGGYNGEYSEIIHEWIEEAMLLDKKDNPNKDYLSYAVTDKMHGTVIGSVGCSYDDKLGKIGIVYFTGAKYRGKGYMTEAAAAYIKYFLEHYNGLEIAASVRARNKASCRVLKKSGFELKETKMYKDFYDENEELYNFYELRKDNES